MTAASIALPPSRSTCRPAADASGWLVAIIARRAITTDRVDRGLGAGRSPGKLGGQRLREQDDERHDGRERSGLHFWGLGMNGGTSCPRAEQSIRTARRRLRVSAFFADWIHQATVRL